MVKTVDGTIHVHTFREGVASRAGHDLVLAAGRWEASRDGHAVELTVDPRALRVVEARGGVKPLTDRDREEIARNIDARVLRGRPIRFRGTATEAEGRLAVEGELELNGQARRMSATLQRSADGRVTGSVPLVQSYWGIRPYSALMGTLKVRDAVDVVIDLRA